MSPFVMAGIEAHTSNEREMSGEGVIAGMWGRFMGEGIFPKIPNRAGESIIALYTDYESDHHGFYTFVLGPRVSSFSELPKGMITRQVPASTYAVFAVPQGPPEKVVVETWKEILADATLVRSYTTDFESYGGLRLVPQCPSRYILLRRAPP
jgi:predicted transcriptional regulator YdeE